jgi:hypothetical protein
MTMFFGNFDKPCSCNFNPHFMHLDNMKTKIISIL